MYVGGHKAGVKSETCGGGKEDVKEQENKQQLVDNDEPAFSSQPGHFDPRDPLNWSLSLKVCTVLILAQADLQA